MFFLRKWTAAQRAEAHRRTKVGIAGARISDLVSLKKALTLCETCSRKFNARTAGYKHRRLVPWSEFVTGECDGCLVMNQCRLFLPHDHP